MNLDKIIAKRVGKTVYLDGDIIVKVFDESIPKANVLNEALNHARVEETGFSIPKIVGANKIDNNWAIESEYIKGTALSVLMEDDKKADEYMELFVDIQMEIHSKKSPLLTNLKDKMVRKISDTDLDATTRYELQTRLDSMPKHKKLCHGDFDPSNVIIQADGSYVVIDWAHATQGNASADVARTYLLFCLEGKTDVAEKYMNIYCKKSDTARQYVDKWLPIVAASQIVKGKAEEREFLLRWIDVVEYE